MMLAVADNIKVVMLGRLDGLDSSCQVRAPNDGRDGQTWVLEVMNTIVLLELLCE
jgi:hypothetical protein